VIKKINLLQPWYLDVLAFLLIVARSVFISLQAQSKVHWKLLLNSNQLDCVC